MMAATWWLSRPSFRRFFPPQSLHLRRVRLSVSKKSLSSKIEAQPVSLFTWSPCRTCGEVLEKCSDHALSATSSSLLLRLPGEPFPSPTRSRHHQSPPCSSCITSATPQVASVFAAPCRASGAAPHDTSLRIAQRISCKFHRENAPWTVRLAWQVDGCVIVSPFPLLHHFLSPP